MGMPCPRRWEDREPCPRCGRKLFYMPLGRTCLACGLLWWRAAKCLIRKRLRALKKRLYFSF